MRGRTLGKDAYGPVGAYVDAGQLAQYIGGGTYLVEVRVLYVYHHALLSHLDTLAHGLDHDGLQIVRRPLERYGADVARGIGMIHGAVAHTAYTDDGTVGLAGNDEEAVLIGNAASDEGRVGGRQQGYVGKLYGLAVAVYHMARHLGGSLLRTLYHDDIAYDLHADGVETYEPLDGVGHAEVLYMLSYAEVLELVVHKIDGVSALPGVHVFQRRGKRHIVVLPGNMLGHGGYQARHTGAKYHPLSLFHWFSFLLFVDCFTIYTVEAVEKLTEN